MEQASHGAGQADNLTSQLVREIHRVGRPMVLVVTGGGSGAIASLLEVPGASQTVLEAAVPYSPAALARWLGSLPEHCCHPRTARAMAMVAWQRARQYLPEPKPDPAGLACTASLATERPKRGEHRLFVALQSGSSTCEWSLGLAKGRRSRAEEEAMTSRVLLDAAADACGIELRLPLDLVEGEQLVLRRCDAPAGWQKLLAGEVLATDTAGQPRPAGSSDRAIFPGAFNPLHAGHRQMAAVAAARLGVPVEFELSIHNVAKPPLDFLEMQDRAGQFVGQRLWFTTADTFVKKSCIFPGCIFVVGTDTLERIADPRFYDDDPARRDAAIAEIAARGCRFLVFGRQRGGVFCSLAELELPAALTAISIEIPVAEFRHDISSTSLRVAATEQDD